MEAVDKKDETEQTPFFTNGYPAMGNNSRACVESADTSASGRDSSDEPSRNEAGIGVTGEPPARRKRGAPRGNQNAFRTGEALMERDKKKRKPKRQLRIARECTAGVIQD